MSVTDYLLLRTPPTQPARMGGKKRAPEGAVSGARIAISFLGIILGIVASFYVTGLRAAGKPSTPAVSQAQGASTPNHPGTSASSPEPSITGDFSPGRLLKVGLISLVICGISYQGLYFALRLYQNEPAFLIVFVAFQYGYFWQSVVKGVAAAVSG